jgi:hypothetical protein
VNRGREDGGDEPGLEVPLCKALSANSIHVTSQAERETGQWLLQAFGLVPHPVLSSPLPPRFFDPISPTALRHVERRISLRRQIVQAPAGIGTRRHPE